jgi:hypothetical protein
MDQCSPTLRATNACRPASVIHVSASEPDSARSSTPVFVFGWLSDTFYSVVILNGPIIPVPMPNTNERPFQSNSPSLAWQ